MDYVFKNALIGKSFQRMLEFFGIASSFTYLGGRKSVVVRLTPAAATSMRALANQLYSVWEAW